MKNVQVLPVHRGLPNSKRSIPDADDTDTSLNPKQMKASHMTLQGLQSGQ